MNDDPIQTNKANEISVKFSRAYNVMLAQRNGSNEDIRFCDVDGGMWEDFYSDQFASRPKMEFNKVNESVYRTYAEWMGNRFRVKYLADDNKASPDDAKILNGLYRRDENHSNGFDSYDNAFSEMIKGGVGAWRLRTQYVNEGDKDDDRQEIAHDPIFNAYNTVVWDDNAKKYDKSDAKWVVVLHEYTKEAYEEQYPNTPASSFGVSVLYDRTNFNWSTKTRVFVAEYYELVEKREKVFVYTDPFGVKKSMWETDIKDMLEELAEGGYEKEKEYKKTRVVVEKTITTADQILESAERIAGKHLPIVPVYGFRAYVDGQEFYYGKVRKLKDPSRLYNMAISRFAEDSSTTSKRVPILYPDEVQGLESYWTEAHLAKYAYLVKNPHLNTDNMEVERQIQYLEPPVVDPNNSAILDIAGAFIDRSAGNNPANPMDSTASGVSLVEQGMRIEMPDSILFENMAKSMRRCGVIYRSIAAEIYDSERFIMLMNEDGGSNPTLLNDFVIGEDGMVKYINNITDGEYKVVVDTGQAFASKRRETVRILQEVIASTPQGSEELPALIGALITNIDAEGMEDVQKWTRNRMIMQGIKDPETEEEIAMVEAAQQQGDEPDGMQELIAATAQKEQAEAAERMSKTQVNMSTAKLNEAKTAETLSGIQLDKVKAGQSAIENQAKRRDAMIPKLMKGLQQAPQPQAAEYDYDPRAGGLVKRGG